MVFVIGWYLCAGLLDVKVEFSQFFGIIRARISTWRKRTGGILDLMLIIKDPGVRKICLSQQDQRETLFLYICSDLRAIFGAFMHGVTLMWCLVVLCVG